jgi:hypothetical protein
MVTLSPSTITGTFRLPSEYFNMVSSLSGLDKTSIYSVFLLAFAKASRAPVVNGQVFLPKIRIFSGMMSSSLFMADTSILIMPIISVNLMRLVA